MKKVLTKTISTLLAVSLIGTLIDPIDIYATNVKEIAISDSTSVSSESWRDDFKKEYEKYLETTPCNEDSSLTRNEDYILNFLKSYKNKLNSNKSNSRSRLNSVKSVSSLKSADLPSKYRSIDELFADYPATRDQYDVGICWSEAGTGMAEFNQIVKGKADKTIDYSELQAAWYTYNSVSDPLGGITDTITTNLSIKDTLWLGGTFTNYENMANAWKATAKEDVYPFDNRADSETYDNSKANSHDLILNEAISFGDADKTTVKEAIIKYGSAGLVYYSGLGSYKNVAESYKDNTGETYTGEYAQDWCYCAPRNGEQNHAVMIVGWDDNFPKEAFSPQNDGSLPSKNGAWLIRNSWTTQNERSKNGYFWLAYDDPSISNFINVADYNDASLYDNNYQYSCGYKDKFPSNEICASVYTAKANSKGKEILSAVNTKIMPYFIEETTPYTIYIYTNLEDESNPYSGKLELIQEETVECNDIYTKITTIPLKRNIVLNEGEKFSIVVDFGGGDICLTTESESETENNVIYTQRSSNHCFYYEDGEWVKEPFDYNLRAFTKNVSNSYEEPDTSCTHSHKKTISKEKTCDIKGVNISYCSDCGTVLSNKSILSNHEDENQKEVRGERHFDGLTAMQGYDGTSNVVYAYGYTGTVYCKVCDKVLEYGSYIMTPPSSGNEDPEDTESEDSENTEVPEHVHDYTYSVNVVKATKTEKGYTEHFCSCGDSYKDNYTDYVEDNPVHKHSYKATVVKPTCEEKGYTLHTCECGDSYKDNYTDETMHFYKRTVVPSTYTEKGYTLNKCTKCGYSYKDRITNLKKLSTASIISAKNTSKCKLYVSVKKIKNATGYEYQIATNKSFKKVLKKIKNTSIKYTFSSLKKNKTYYVRVRAYRKEGSKIAYSNWSLVMTVKIKK